MECGPHNAGRMQTCERSRALGLGLRLEPDESMGREASGDDRDETGFAGEVRSGLRIGWVEDWSIGAGSCRWENGTGHGEEGPPHPTDTVKGMTWPPVVMPSASLVWKPKLGNP